MRHKTLSLSLSRSRLFLSCTSNFFFFLHSTCIIISHFVIYPFSTLYTLFFIKTKKNHFYPNYTVYSFEECRNHRYYTRNEHNNAIRLCISRDERWMRKCCCYIHRSSCKLLAFGMTNFAVYGLYISDGYTKLLIG